MKCYLDCETCGLHGVAVIIQYAYDDGPIEIHNFWTRPIKESLELIEKICTCDVIGFNLAFDWFHIVKIYSILNLMKAELGEYAFPDEWIEVAAKLEKDARDGPCIKPAGSFDIMLHARKTEYQTTMERKDIRVRRVPTALAWSLAKVLEEKIVLDPILFSRSARKIGPKWVVHDIKRHGQINRDFKDLVLKFKPSMSLKNLAIHALKIPNDEVLQFVDVSCKEYPAEVGYAPYHEAVSRLSKRLRKKLPKFTWPKLVKIHIDHWEHNQLARRYARMDVDHTRKLYYHFDCPKLNDDDSVLATMAGAVRWRGYAIDIEGLKEVRLEAIKKVAAVPISPNAVKRWISEVLSEEEKAAFTSTGKMVLERMASEIGGSICPFGPCQHCIDGKLPAPESAKRAQAVLEARQLAKEIELYDKLLVAGRFHASVKVIGALSGRMSGADGLNPQGINKTKKVREKFPLAFGFLKLKGGDFEGFEVVLADASYHDDNLRKDLLTCEKCRDVQVQYIQGIKRCPKCGGNKTLKIHALFGVHVYPDMTYDQIKATSQTADDKYTRAKSAVFALIYGGLAYTLMTRLGVPIEVAQKAYELFVARYVGVGKARERVINAFCSIHQEAGIGSKIHWADPAEYVESLLGFKRYFILENRITKEIFELAQNPPEDWRNLKVKVYRRDRDQTIGGAVQSALYGTAFQIQAANMRAAANHEIQSTGAQITKRVQRRIWDIQPNGINEWLVQPLNIHDEVLSPTHPSVADEVSKVVFETVESYRPIVPLIEFEWKDMNTWASK